MKTDLIKHIEKHGRTANAIAGYSKLVGKNPPESISEMIRDIENTPTEVLNRVIHNNNSPEITVSYTLEEEDVVELRGTRSVFYTGEITINIQDMLNALQIEYVSELSEESIHDYIRDTVYEDPYSYADVTDYSDIEIDSNSVKSIDALNSELTDIDYAYSEIEQYVTATLPEDE